jgi:hypothetical protein
MQVAAGLSLGTGPQAQTADFNSGPQANSRMPFAMVPETSVFTDVLFSFTKHANSDENGQATAIPQRTSARETHKNTPKSEPESSPAGNNAIQEMAETPAVATGTPNSQQAQVPAETTQAPQRPENAKAPIVASSNLAFAMRVDTINNTQPQRDAGEVNTAVELTDPAPRGLHAPAMVEEVTHGSQEHDAIASNKDSHGVASEEQTSLPSRTFFSAGQQAVSRVRNDFDAELSHATAEIRGAHVQVVGTGTQRVDIQLIERGGSLAVTVRSTDSTLTRELQDHIPELAARLQSDHYQSQTWTPSSGNSAGARDGGGSSSGQSNFSTGGGGQRQRRDGAKPRWVEELENNERKSSNKESLYVSSN